MDFERVCLTFYRASVPRSLRDVVGRLRTRGWGWARADGGWGFQDYSAARWEREYRGDKWRYMGGLPELARYSVVVGYVQYFAPEGELLDLGCGEGILQARLGCMKYARYVGADVSRTAIEVASARADERTRFVCAGVEHFEPEGTFDVIVLNEVLYYFSDPLRVLRRYARFLKPGGVFIVSMFETDETRANWHILERDFDFIDETRSSNRAGGFAWDCRVARLARSA